MHFRLSSQRWIQSKKFTSNLTGLTECATGLCEKKMVWRIAENAEASTEPFFLNCKGFQWVPVDQLKFEELREAILSGYEGFLPHSV